jgi:hypothetical protein
MKKSIMIEIINESVKEWHELYKGNQEGYTVSHHILRRIEDAGMLPPFQSKEYPEMNEYFVLMVEENPVPGICEWETEDDQ